MTVYSYPAYQSSSDTNPSILFIGNDSKLHSNISSALFSRYRVKQVADMIEAHQLVDRSDVDCALVEIPNRRDKAQLILKEIQRISKELPVIVLCSASDISSGVEAIRAGAADFVITEVEIKCLASRLEKTLGRLTKYVQDASIDGVTGERSWTPGQIVLGRSKRMMDAIKLARRAASFPAPVLILGESGTGKELFAQWIHRMSDRANGPFVAINLAAIPEDLIESTLFGHVKGAFTGAVGQRVGKFGLAQGGTLLLDEITELKLELQPKLLRVLQEGEFELVGGERTIKTEARIIAATNRNVFEQVENGAFRGDLLYRLNVITITLPPLRERKEDIPDMVDLFLAKYDTLYGKVKQTVSQDGMEALLEYQWPGNIRELENLIQRAVIVADGDEIALEELWDQETRIQSAPPPRAADSLGSLEDVERQYIEEVLRRTAGHQGEAAKILDIDRKTLYNKIMKYGLGRSLQRVAS